MKIQKGTKIDEDADADEAILITDNEGQLKQLL